MSKLFVVATPIGNLGDISARALEVLRSVSVILCEDTRVTKKLLSHFNIHTPTLSYHAHSGAKKVADIVRLLRDEKDLALVSDAGTPGVSDPGSYLVNTIREEIPKVEIIAVPGPSALVAAISIAGFPASDFLFLGFLPHKKGRQTLFKEIALSNRAVVFYESPHRFVRTLQSLTETLSSTRVIFVGRELTKMFEEGIRGRAREVLAYFDDQPEKVRGEFVVVVSPE